MQATHLKLETRRDRGPDLLKIQNAIGMAMGMGIPMHHGHPEPIERTTEFITTKK